MANYSSNNRPLISTGATAIISAVLILFLAFGMWGCPTYKVYVAEKEGMAQLAEAKYAKQAQVEAAKANYESEKYNADAEVVRAEGAAKAIKIENGSLSYMYILYLWVRQQANLSDRTVVYIPTGKAGLPDFQLPVTEANRLSDLSGSGVLKPEYQP